MPAPTAELAVVMLSYNTREVTLRALADVFSTEREIALEVVVVDNASADGSADAIAGKFPRARVIRNAVNRGFAAAVNQAVAVTRAPAILLLNSDCFLGDPDARGESDGSRGAALLRSALQGLFSASDIASFGIAVLDGTGKKYVSARPFPTLVTYFTDRFGGSPAYPPDGAPMPADVDWINGAFWLINRRAWNAIGPLDERFFFGWEDIDWHYQAGLKRYRVLHDARLRVTHLGGESAKKRTDDVIVGHNMMLKTYLTGREKYWRKNYGWLSTQMMRAASIAISAPSWIVARVRGDSARAAVEKIRIAHALGARDASAPGGDRYNRG